MIQKIHDVKLKIGNLNRGMTILELLVVLGIFALISTVAIFNYGTFQSKIDITNLADDIALQVVQAQNASLSGLLPAAGQQVNEIANWKPSYGVYFSSSTGLPDLKGADTKDFIYFVDLDDGQDYDSAGGCGAPLTGECISKYTITTSNSISSLSAYYTDGTHVSLTNATITFARPNSGAAIKSNIVFPKTVAYLEVAITSPKGTVTSTIDLYSSGRVQIN